MGIITSSPLLDTQEELVWINYIDHIATKTFNLFKNAIAKNNTQVKLVIDATDYEPNVMGHYSDQRLRVITHNILRTAIGYGKERLVTVINTITINAVIHELFHADQYLESRIEIDDRSVIEDSVYSITLQFITTHYDYICQNIGYIDLGDLQAQYNARNLALYGSLKSPYDHNQYERISPQLMIDNIIRFISSAEVFEKYKNLSPLTCPSIGIDLTGSGYMNDVIWVKLNNEYNIVNIRYIQRECERYTRVGSEISFSEQLFKNENSIIFVFKLHEQLYHPIYFKEEE